MTFDYRSEALKILPWVCAVCQRKVPGSRLRELTVRHKDGDYLNNPVDGSNWEILCKECKETAK